MPSGKGSTSWTDAERVALLVQIVQQLQSGGAKIDLNKVNMPGRTPKALSHIIANMKTEAANYVAARTNSPGSGKKNTSASPSGRKRLQEIKAEEVDSEEEEDAGPPVKKPRVAAKAAKTRKSTTAAGNKNGKKPSPLALPPILASDPDPNPVPVSEPQLPTATMDQVYEAIANAQVAAAAFEEGEF